MMVLLLVHLGVVLPWAWRNGDARDADARHTTDRPPRRRLGRAVLDEHGRTRSKSSYRRARK